MEHGYVNMEVYCDRFEAKFYSTTKNKIRDQVTMYHVKKTNHFPVYLWVFFGLLILFALFIFVWLIRLFLIKRKKQKLALSQNQKLLIEHE